MIFGVLVGLFVTAMLILIAWRYKKEQKAKENKSKEKRDDYIMK